MNRFTIAALAAALALLSFSTAHAATKTAKKEKAPAASAKPAIMECCAKGGCANCEAGNTAFFTATACSQCAAGVMNVAMHSHGDSHVEKAMANSAFFTATACSAKSETAAAGHEMGSGKAAPKAGKAKK